MFYKGRYLIALYEDDELLRYVFDKGSDLAKFLCRETTVITSQLTRCFYNEELTTNIDNYKIYLIDTQETHNDQFKQEDKIFNDYIKKENTNSMKSYCQEHQISCRTYFRRKKLGLINFKKEDMVL